MTMIGSRCGSHQGNTVAHIFQRARNGFVVFYNVKDSLFFITLFCIIARRHGVKVLALCLMYNHVHILLDTDDKESIRLFIKELMSYFCKSYNRRYGFPECCSIATVCRWRKVTKPLGQLWLTSTTTRSKITSAGKPRSGDGTFWHIQTLTTHIQRRSI